MEPPGAASTFTGGAAASDPGSAPRTDAGAIAANSRQSKKYFAITHHAPTKRESRSPNAPASDFDPYVDDLAALPPRRSCSKRTDPAENAAGSSSRLRQQGASGLAPPGPGRPSAAAHDRLDALHRVVLQPAAVAFDGVWSHRHRTGMHRTVLKGGGDLAVSQIAPAIGFTQPFPAVRAVRQRPLPAQ